jgi:hypothetical protein
MIDVLLYVLVVMMPGTAFLYWMWQRDKHVRTESEVD